jgi:hypothetical protein
MYNEIKGDQRYQALGNVLIILIIQCVQCPNQASTPLLLALIA